MATTKSDIIQLLKTLATNGILEDELESELEKNIQKFDDLAFDKCSTPIELHFNSLLPLAYMNVASQGYDAKKISCFSKNVSQAMKLHNYSIVELLIKLKLIYSDLLKHGRLSKVQSSPLYFERTSDGLLQSNAAEQQEFLNELMNAPLDDIAIYLENIGKQFEQFYTTDIIEQLIDRIGYGNHNVRIDSNDILDQLFILIIKPMARKYSRLTGLQLITYIDNKYHSTETDKYRVLLERFVETNPQPQFTFANFYRMVNIRPLFDSKQETLLSDLFTIYCQKILDIDKKKCFLEKGDFQEIRPRQYRKMQEQITGRDNFQKIAQSTRSRKCSASHLSRPARNDDSGYMTHSSGSRKKMTNRDRNAEDDCSGKISTPAATNNQRNMKQNRQLSSKSRYSKPNIPGAE